MPIKICLLFLLLLGWFMPGDATALLLTDTNKINRLNKLAADFGSGHPDSSIVYSEMAVRLARQSGYKKGIADGLLTAANIYFTQGKHGLAVRYLTECDSLYAAIGDQAGLGNCDKIFGDLYCQNSDYKQALFYYQRSLGVKLRLKDQSGISRLYLDLGNVYNGMSAYSTALDYYFKSLNIDSKLHNERAIAGDYIDIGYLLQNMEIYPKALDYYQKALAIYIKLQENDGIAIAKQNIGEVFLAQGKYPDAISYIDEALVIYQKWDNKDGISQLNSDLGLCYLNQQQYPVALGHLQIALQVAAANQLDGDRTMALTDLALYYNINQQYPSAYRYAVEAKSWADHIHSILLQRGADAQCIRSLGGLGQYKAAFTAQQELDKLNFDAHKDESVQKFTLYNTEYNYAIAEEERQIQQKASALLYQQKIRGQRLLNIIFLIICLASVVVIVVYYKQKRTQMRINAQLNAKNEEVLQQQTDLNVQARELNESNKLKDRLISILAHDLRSPLSTLRGLFKLLEDDSLSMDELLAMIPGVVAKLDHTSDFLDTLLFWINSQLENYHSSTKCFWLNEVVEGEYENYKEQAGIKGIELHTDVDASLKAFADPNSVRIVLRNLVTNAIKFSGNGDRISISARREEPNVLLAVRDTGIGMTPEQQSQLFKNRVDSTIGTHNESGTGMGLLFCKDLVEKSNGEIWVESQLNKGTVFYLSIPTDGC
jgi:signal transduction histidine kinase